MDRIGTDLRSIEARDRLMALANGHGRTLGAELSALLDEAEEREWWRTAKQSAARLQADGDQWEEYLAEADAWDGALPDGLSDQSVEWPEDSKDGA